jgi:hypothetical protein
MNLRIGLKAIHEHKNGYFIKENEKYAVPAGYLPFFLFPFFLFALFPFFFLNNHPDSPPHILLVSTLP